MEIKLQLVMMLEPNMVLFLSWLLPCGLDSFLGSPQISLKAPLLS